MLESDCLQMMVDIAQQVKDLKMAVNAAASGGEWSRYKGYLSELHVWKVALDNSAWEYINAADSPADALSKVYWEFVEVSLTNLARLLLGRNATSYSLRKYVPSLPRVMHLVCEGCQKEFDREYTGKAVWLLTGEVVCSRCRGKRDMALRLREGESEKLRAASGGPSYEQLRWMPYPDYLQTKHWQDLRHAKLKEAGYHCTHPGCTASYSNGYILDVHHLTYERRGCELLTDLQVLCREHHEAVKFLSNGQPHHTGGKEEVA